MTWRWGVIGAGGIADRRTIPEGIVPSKRCELVAVMDVDEARVREVAKKYGVSRATTDVKELLSWPQVQVVYVGTPVRVHPDQCVAAAEAGKHILCEKPLALTAAECRRVTAAAQANGVKLAVGYMMRFQSLHRRLKEMIDAGDLGQPVLARANFTCWYPDIPGAWRQDPKQGGGGALPDLGTHCIDLLRWLLGEVKSVTANADTITFRYPVDDIATIMLKFDSGAHGVIEACFNVPDAASQYILEVYGTKGAVLADHTVGQMAGGSMVAHLVDEPGGYNAAQGTPSGGRTLKIEEPSVNMYQAEAEDLLDAIEQDREPLNNGAEATRVQEIVEAAYKSSRTGRRQDVER
jgi:predicted dehydrogenase